MNFEKEIFLNVSQFLEHPAKKVLLIVAEVDKNFHKHLMYQAEQKSLSSCCVDLSKPFESEKLTAHDVIVFDNWGENGEVENIYVKYQLEGFSEKFIFICRELFLHPTLDPSIYFAPIKSGRVQRHLLSKLILSVSKAKKSALNPVSAVVEQASSAKPIVMWHQKLMTQDAVMMQMFADNVTKNEKFKDFLFKAIYASRDDHQMQVAAANAITALNYARVFFSGMDLSKIKIPHADLSQSIVDNAQFQEADLRFVNFTGSWMRETNFANAKMSNINIGQKPFLKLPEIVRSCCYSPDGRWLAIGGEIKIYIYSINDQKICFILEGHEKWIEKVVFSPDGKYLASGGRDSYIFIWPTDTWKQPKKLQENDEIYTLAFSPDSQLLAAGGMFGLRIWDMETYLPRRTFGEGLWIYSCVFDLNKQIIIAGDGEGEIYFWDISSGELRDTFHGHTSGISGLAFNPKRTQLVSASWDETVCLWNITTGSKPLILSGHGDEVKSVAFSPDGEFVASGADDGIVFLWSAQTGKPVDVFEGHTSWVISVAFSPDGNYLTSGGDDKEVRFWVVAANQKTENFINHMARELPFSQGLVFSPDGNKLLLSGGGVIYTCLCSTWQPDAMFEENDDTWVRDVAFRPDGNQIAAASYKTIGLWNANTQKIEYSLPDCKEGAERIVYSPCGKYLAAACGFEKTVGIWHTATGELYHKFNNDSHNVHDVAFTYDSKKLVSCSDDKCIRLWNVEKPALEFTLEKHIGSVESVALSSDGKWLASGGGWNDKTIWLWDMASYTPEKQLAGHVDEVLYLKFSPNNLFLCSASADHKVCLWDVQTGERLKVINGLKNPRYIDWKVTSSELFLVIGSDYTISYWSVLVDKHQKIERVVLLWINRSSNNLVISDINIKGAELDEQTKEALMEIQTNKGNEDYLFDKRNDLVSKRRDNTNTNISLASSTDEENEEDSDREFDLSDDAVKKLEEASKALADRKISVALNIFESGIEKHPGCTSFYEGIAHCCWLSALHDKNESLLKRAGDAFEQALSKKINSHLQIFYGLYLFYCSNFQGALSSFKKALALEYSVLENADSDDEDKEVSIEFDEFNKCYLVEEISQEVTEAGSTAFALIPLSYYFIIYIQILLNQKTEVNMYLQDFVKYISRKSDPLIYSLLAYSYKRLGQYNQAALYFMQALEFNPDYKLAERNMRECFALEESVVKEGGTDDDEVRQALALSLARR